MLLGLYAKVMLDNLRIGATDSGNLPSGIVTKPPKPVSSVLALVTWVLSGFITWGATVYNLFNIGRHMVSANHYRSLRISAFSEAGRSLESGWKIPAAWFS